MKKLYLFLFLLILATVGYGQFTEINAGLMGSFNPVWIDYDSDGDLDILLPGYGGPTTKLYQNNNGIFTQTYTNLPPLDAQSIDLGDYDNDGDIDIVVKGISDGSNYTGILRNDGNGNFTNINAGLPYSYSLAWGDYDNDGDLDILLTGEIDNAYITRIYRNDGNGIFVGIDVGLSGVQGSAVWGDYDNDGDLDILLGGWLSGNAGLATKIYRNNGNGTFTDINAGLTGLTQIGNPLAWGDYDSDGDLDVLISGYNGGIYLSIIYRNDGNDTFTNINAGLAGAISHIKWADFNNDGNLDVIIAGASEIYLNINNTLFLDSNAGLAVGTTSIDCGDYDNDGDVDLLLSGSGFTKIYRNDTNVTNTNPTSPSNLGIQTDNEFVRFHWNASTDSQTASNGLNYSVRIGTTPGGSQICSSMSISNGHRLIPEYGKINSNCFYKIVRSALPDSFYWSVQAIDGAFKGSAFATEQFVSFQPRIHLDTTASIQYGDIAAGNLSAWSEVVIHNSGMENLNINNLHFLSTTSQFQSSYANLGNAILPGEVATILVRFAPTMVGAVNDTLYIVSNAVNTPVLKIRLSGMGISVPPSIPQNISVVMQGNNAMLSWDAVTTDIHGNAMTPDYYIILHNENPYANIQDYYYLGFTDQLSYSHIGVGRFRPQMYYRVIAYKDYGRGNLPRLADLNGTNRKIRYKDIGIE